MNELTIPFFYNANIDKDNGGKPGSLLFQYYYNSDLSLYQQIPNDYTSEILEQVYKEGSMMNGEMDYSTGGLQGQAAVDYILTYIANKNYSSVLEIGCGNGYVLKELSKTIKRCVGLEPGPQATVLTKDCPDIEVIHEFFPTPKINTKFDLLLHFNVLEHVIDPAAFLAEQLKLLTENGMIVFGVPNCEPNLKCGDLSIFLHEHYSYFTRDSIVAISKLLGAEIINMEVGAAGGMIFCSLGKNNPRILTELSGHAWQLFDYKNSLTNISKIMLPCAQEDIAVYCPKRAMNALSILQKYDIRLVDDTSSLTGKFLPTFNLPVEDFSSLTKSPPKLLIIFSRTFGKQILLKCKSSDSLSNTKIFLLEDFD